MSRLKLAMIVSIVLAFAVTFAVVRTYGQVKIEVNESIKTDSKTMEPAEEKAELQAKVGEKAPDFTLTDTEGKEHSLAAYLEDGKRVVLEWFNPDCPFVQKHHMKTRNMSDTYRTAMESDVVWLAINSNAPGKQGSGVDRNKKARADYEIAYPLLLDEEGTVGKMYGAKTTPHMYLIDTDGTLVYAGAIDNLPNPHELGDTNYVLKALESCVAGKEVAESKTRPYGCSVKYAS